jgi:FkbM family methyltransferase
VTSSPTPNTNKSQTNVWGTLRIKGWKSAWLSLCHALPPLRCMKRIALWIRKPIKMVLRDWVDVTVWGLDLRLFPKGNLSEQRILFLPQFFDRVERLAIKESLNRGGVFVDIGANIGAYSFWAASLENNIQVEAFEPDQELCARMQFNLHTNTLHNVRIHQIALGDHSGTIALAYDSTNRGQTRVVEISNEQEVQVPIERLPDVLANNDIKKIDALKIDVEGNEVSVLKPLLKEEHRHLWPNLIVCEIEKHCTSKSESPPWKLLSDVGYVLQKRTRLNGIFRLVSEKK